MAWPSGSKAGTTNVDAGADRPSLARPDIKQNIDNVNSIIDEFNISSPSNGDLLQYSTSTSKWEQVASSSVGGGGSIALIKIASGEELVGGSTYRRTIDIQFDPDSFITATSDYQITLAAGNYIFQPDQTVLDSQEVDLLVTNETAGASLGTIDITEVGSTTDGVVNGIVYGTIHTTSAVIAFRQTTSSSQERDMIFQMMIYKL